MPALYPIGECSAIVLDGWRRLGSFPRMVRLSTYPYVIVRLGCTVCARRGQYRLARLAEAFGAEATLEAVLDSVTKDCPWRLDPRKYGGCGCFARDLASPTLPPDLPPDMRKLHVIKGGRK